MLPENKRDYTIPSTILFDHLNPNGIRRWLRAWGAYDFSPKVPGEPNYGIHGMELVWGVQRGQIAVTWRMMLPWYLQSNREQGPKARDYNGLGDICSHSPEASYVGQWREELCEYTGRHCYGSVLYSASRDLFDKFVERPECLWQELEKWLEEAEIQAKNERELRSAMG